MHFAWIIKKVRGQTKMMVPADTDDAAGIEPDETTETATAVDAAASEEVAETLAILAGVTHGLVEHDDTTDVLLKIWGSEKKLSVELSVFVGVFDLDSIESLSNGSGTLISGEDSLTWSSDLLGGLHEFFLEFSTSVGVFGLHLFFLFNLDYLINTQDY